MPLPSPYTPGEAPPVLVGRGAQLSDAQADLALLATYGRFLGRVRVHVGSRGVGKTSLLKAVRDEAARARAARAISRSACTEHEVPSQLVPRDRTDER